MAIGSEGSIVLSTHGGHVYLRSSRAANTGSGSGVASGSGGGGKPSWTKFQRVPYLQRVIHVCANSTGAYGALRVDYRPEPIVVLGNGIAEDLASVRPYMQPRTPGEDEESFGMRGRVGGDRVVNLGFPPDVRAMEDDERDDDPSIERDVDAMQKLCDVLLKTRGHRPAVANICGADVLVEARIEGKNSRRSGQMWTFPAHGVLLACRSNVLRQVIYGTTILKDQESGIGARSVDPPYPTSHGSSPLAPSANPLHKLIQFTYCHPLSVLILLDFCYTDQLLIIWDHRISQSSSLMRQFKDLGVSPTKIKAELQALARILGLSQLTEVLSAPVKRDILPTLGRDLKALDRLAQTDAQLQSSNTVFPKPDVILQLADKAIFCYSAILRSRSVFFAAFFDETEEWTKRRWNHGLITVDMKHLSWAVMEYVLRFICCGEETEMFEVLGRSSSSHHQDNTNYEIRLYSHSGRGIRLHVSSVGCGGASSFFC